MPGIGSSVPILGMAGGFHWTPTVLGALVRNWYIAEGSEAGGTWTDIGGSGRTLTQAAGNIESREYRGRPTVWLDGTGYMQTGSFTSTHPCEFWVACKCETAGVIIAGRTADSTMVVRTSSPTTRIQLANEYGVLVDFTVASGDSLTNRWVALRARFNGAAAQVWENGVSSGEAAVSSSLNPSGITIGAGSAGWSPIQIEYGEVLHTSLLTTNEAYRMARYLTRTWV